MEGGQRRNAVVREVVGDGEDDTDEKHPAGLLDEQTAPGRAANEAAWCGQLGGGDLEAGVRAGATGSG
jgi:hypothetical protein